MLTQTRFDLQAIFLRMVSFCVFPSVFICPRLVLVEPVWFWVEPVFPTSLDFEFVCSPNPILPAGRVLRGLTIDWFEEMFP